MNFLKNRFKILLIAVIFILGLCNHSVIAANGVCGSTHYNCASGIFNGTETSGGCNQGPDYTYYTFKWNWQCNGDNGSATCYEEKPICGTANGASFTSLDLSATNLCLKCNEYETQEFLPTDFRETDTGWTWTCRSKHGNPGCNNNVCLFAPPVNCSANKIARASCSYASPDNVNIYGATHDVYAYGVGNASTVYFAVWSTANGQDDIWWYEGTNQGGGTWKATVNFASHHNNEIGQYNAHAYLADSAGFIYCNDANFVRLAPINGVCNSTHYNCNIGTSINNLQGGASWAWQCQGSGGGTTTTCSQNFPTCTYDYGLWSTCINGTQTRTVTATNSPCIGTPITSQSCTVPVAGVCNSTHYNCDAGTSGTNLQGGASWAWICNGLNGGANATCSQNFPTCTYDYGLWSTCINGTQTRTVTATNSPCTGTPITSQSCIVPINGVCNSTHYNCDAGTSINNLQGGASWAWQCQGSGGGTTTTCSQNFPTCTYIYGSWGACSNGIQTRTATAANSPCTGTPITSQPCGTCGPAAKTYLMSVGAYEGAQCTTGIPSNTAFPEKGATITWICTVADGTSSSTCSANRLNINPSWIEN